MVVSPKDKNDTLTSSGKGMDEPIPVVDTEEGLDDDEEYRPNPKVEEAMDEPLEYQEEETTGDLSKNKDLENPDEFKMVEEDEREIAGGGR
ncbi:hypothetical protein BGZ70_000575 [Mortierella alpina]|uniref:Uncharacterized protein n=1 Tax=Mortierella alpina TaxID=64518 RepID=A0A9P6IXL2_MORAP|nr:hypothetical protein BGZ70_000575 [Mortierella alpina]